MIHTALMGVVERSSTNGYSTPFVGRREEVQTITSFCRNVCEEDELAVCWIQGEAGIGKSALMREVERGLRGKDRIVLTVCLYPDSVESVVSLLCDALNASPSISRLLTDSVSQSLPSVLATLRRLARLRTLSLVLEDIHLMSDEAGIELLSVLHGLRNESVAVLCVSRITDGESYARLLPYIRTTLELSPLTTEEVEELATSTLSQFQITGRMLYEGSRGYPLVLHAMIQELRSLPEQTPESLQRQQQALISNRAALSIRGLTTAFLSGLTEEEKRITRRLATLGEQFSGQGAAIMLGEHHTLLNRLLEKGVILRSATYSLPVFGSYESTIPYRFNHTLLFEELLNDAVIGEQDIFHVIEEQTPLYAVTIFQQIDRTVPEVLDSNRVERIIRLLTKAASELELRLASNQKLAEQFYRFAAAIYQRHQEIFSPERRRIMLIELSASAVQSLRQQVFTRKHLDRLEEFTQLTKSPESEEIALYRATCLSNRLLHSQEEDVSNILAEAEALRMQFPSLPQQDEFIRLVANLAWKCLTSDGHIFSRIQALFDEILSVVDPTLHVNSLSFAGTQMLAAASAKAENREEMDRAIEFSYTFHSFLSPHCDERQALVLDSIRAYVFYTTGHLLETVKTFHHYRNGLLHPRDISILYMKRLLLSIQAAIGLPISILESRCFEHLKEMREMIGSDGKESPDSLPRSQWILGVEVLTQGYLLGDLAWGERLSTQIMNGSNAGTAEIMPINRAAAIGDRTRLKPFTEDDRLGPLIRAAIGETDDPTKAIETVRTLLGRGILNLGTLFELQTIIDLVKMAQQANPAHKALAELTTELATAVRQAINWCIEKRMPGYAAPFLNAGDEFFPPKEHARLSEKVEKMKEKVTEELHLHELVPKNTEDTRMTLSVIGSISASGTSATLQRFQGGRVRRGVAMIAATGMMKHPLSLSEFRHILTGIPSDSEKGASYTRTLLWRIRSVLGPDSIIADGETPPRFDTAHVRVDLFDAAQALERCERALRESRPRHAREALMQALQIIGEGPIYPTLYDEFFEAARLDFEVRIREAVRSTVTLLRREGDIEEAERLLRNALYTLPGDDELIEEQIDILQQLGRNAEGVALRQRTGQRSAA